MSSKFFNILLLSIILFAIIISGCSAEAAKPEKIITQAVTENSSSKPTIEIKPNSPADTVRAFYKNLREKKIRDAIFLTNLRPAVEGLTDNELKELDVDFAALAEEVPAEIQINGEIVSGDKATVTANLPDGGSKKMKIQQIKLYREGEAWIIKTVEGKDEQLVKKEGNKYFFAVKIEAYQEEAKDMLDRIMKAQVVMSVKNKGAYADMPELIENNFVPADVSNTRGYKYNMILSADKKKYTATAEPVVYGKTGKLSFVAEGEYGKDPRLGSIDKGGK
jgi:PBP1b-binding outer membrane lipoprotein LpoB